MFNSLKRFTKLLSYITGISIINFVAQNRPTQAQITPDNSLPINSSVNTSGTTINITGGTIGGSGNNVNLYHSFSQFSVPANQTAYFNNATNVSNIITRITGVEKSVIEGKIRANGSANLFIINPNGIRFGSNASLNIGGSFLASSADAIKLEDGTIFSAKSPQNTPLLTISVPVGLQFGESPGTIENLSRFRVNTTSPRVGLQVPTGKTLALVGGDVILDRGRMTVNQGRIELGSVGTLSEVKIIPTTDGFTLGYNQVQNFKDINLITTAIIDASGEGGGNINIQGKRITLNDGSIIQAATLATKSGGIIDINAAESIEMKGLNSAGGSSSIVAGTTGIGKAGDININTQKLLLQDGAQIGVSSLSMGQGGNLTVKANTIEMFSINTNFETPTGLFSESQKQGKAGNLTVITNNLLLQDGAQISVTSFAQGQGGALDITAKSVKLIGNFNNGQLPSGLLALTYSTGDAGELTLNTESLMIEKGAQIATTTFEQGKGGNININATKLIQVDGTTDDEQFYSGIFANTQGTGNAGNLTLNTPKLIVLNGAQIGGTTRNSGHGGNLNLTTTESLEISGKSSSGQSFSSLSVRSLNDGDAGILTVNSPVINIIDEGKITAEGLGQGNAGTLTLNTNFLNLLNKGLITASTTSGEGGNINLNINNILLMRNQSLINATAGGSGNGGNIIINAPFLIAIDTENSDIFANAFQGRGGNINITTNGIYGLQFRNKPSDLSDITASSEFGINGSVQINTPGLDPQQGLVQLSGQILNISGLVEKGCNSRSANNNIFISTGRGGLPNNPLEPIENKAILADLGEKISTHKTIIPENNIHQSEKKTPQLIESQGWIINSKGEIVLTANNPHVTPHNSGFKSLNCGGN